MPSPRRTSTPTTFRAPGNWPRQRARNLRVWRGRKGLAVRVRGGRLFDQSAITLGNITVTALHTPGHTPEHLAFLITDGAFSDQPGFLLSGDFVFSGDLGRPDLLDEAAGGTDTRFGGARDLFVSLKTKFLTLPDYVQVYPGHGAGSACGKALGAIPSTTVGYERNFAWWGVYLAANDEAGFVEALLDGQPDAHAYFGRMKRQNRQGPAVMGRRAPLAELATGDVAAALAADEIGIVDTRHHSQVHAGTVAGALNIPAGKRAASYGAWTVDPETDKRPLVLLAPDSKTATEMWDHLVRVGIDAVAGYVRTLDGLPSYTPETLAPADLAGFDAATGAGRAQQVRTRRRAHPRLRPAQRRAGALAHRPASGRRRDRQLLPVRGAQLRGSLRPAPCRPQGRRARGQLRGLGSLERPERPNRLTGALALDRLRRTHGLAMTLVMANP